MKILVLMPLQEQYEFAASAIYKALPHEVKEVTFVMPMFMNFLVTTKIAPNYSYSVFDALLTAEKLSKTADDSNANLVIIGNVKSDCHFDAIFNFQDIEQDLPYQDDFITKLIQIVKDEPTLEYHINDLHQAQESKMALHNCTATADFLAAYLKTDPQLDQIKADYQKALEGIKNGTYHSA